MRLRLRRRPRVTPEQVLGSRPVRNENLSVEETEDGGLRIVARRRETWWIRVLNAVLPIPRERRIELDVVGKQVWELCDGEHTLKDMIEAFQERHKLTRMEAEWSLRNYLRDLGKRGLVGFVVEKREE
ncbi:MAG TPA: PqqD family protein [Armatimonadota bacterium]|nr:PqqD family protein [Armatimonadota bacterium]